MPALIGITITGFAGYGALLPTTPLYAVEGGASEAGAGLVNGVLLLFTVLTQLFIPGLLKRFGWGSVLTAGMLLMGLSALGNIISDGLWPILILSAIRGVGFGVLTVTGSAAVAELVEPTRRGAAIGAYGLAIALPNLIFLPLAPWAAQTWGFPVVFVIAALPLAGIPSVWAMARVLDPPSSDDDVAEVDITSQSESTHTYATDAESAQKAGSAQEAMSGQTAYLRLLRPTFLLLAVTLAGGALLTFAPQMVDSGAVSTAALFATGATAALARWRMGGLSDRFGAQPFMWPLTMVTVLGMGLAAFSVLGEVETTTSLVLFVVAASIVGVSYGGLQNLTLVVAFEAVTREHYRRASAVWNVGFDLGSGMGSVLVGLLATGFGFGPALFVAAAVSLCTLPLALRRPRVR